MILWRYGSKDESQLNNDIDNDNLVWTMGPDEDLPTLIKQKDHLNVLRYIRAHQLRESELVLAHGKALLGPKLSRRLSDESARLSVLEQICLAAMDTKQTSVAEICLAELAKAIGKEPVRFRLLLARCLEGSGDFEKATLIYDDILKDNPSNLMALKRKYCMATTDQESVERLTAYLQQNLADTAAWYEMATLRLSIGDYKAAAYALEEVVLGTPLDDKVHCQLAEVYATLGGVENLQNARKHMAQALELEPSNQRAMFGLVSVAKAYLAEISQQGKKKPVDEHDVEVAKELVKYGADKLLKSYKGTKLYAAVQQVLEE